MKYYINYTHFASVKKRLSSGEKVTFLKNNGINQSYLFYDDGKSIFDYESPILGRVKEVYDRKIGIYKRLINDVAVEEKKLYVEQFIVKEILEDSYFSCIMGKICNKLTLVCHDVFDPDYIFKKSYHYSCDAEILPINYDNFSKSIRYNENVAFKIMRSLPLKIEQETDEYYYSKTAIKIVKG